MMRFRTGLILALLIAGMTGVVSSTNAATYRTRNFVVKAIRADVARQCAEYAEYYRRTKAIEWLGYEIPDWNDPCHVEVVLKLGDAGGATSFVFDKGRVLGQDMTVEGPLERILHSVLPHEVTHTIFAAKFGRPLPRWADEGGAVLSEDASELDRHDRLVREVINDNRMIPLHRLFVLTEYPNDVMALYAEGFSIANYLVTLKGKPYFLDFVADGQTKGWDRALASYYGIYNTDALEGHWIGWLREGRGTGADQPLYAARTPPPSRTTQNSAMVARGEMPDDPWTNRPVATARPTNSSSSMAAFEPSLVTPAIANTNAYTSPHATAAAGNAGWTRIPQATLPAGSGTIGETTVSASPTSLSTQEPTTASSRGSLTPPRRWAPVAVGRTHRNDAP